MNGLEWITNLVIKLENVNFICYWKVTHNIKCSCRLLSYQWEEENIVDQDLFYIQIANGG